MFPVPAWALVWSFTLSLLLEPFFSQEVGGGTEGSARGTSSSVLLQSHGYKYEWMKSCLLLLPCQSPRVLFFFFLSFPLLFFSSVTRFTEASDVICRQPARYWLETRASDWFSARHNSDNVQKNEQSLTLVWNRNALVISHVLPSTGNNLCFQQERH